MAAARSPFPVRGLALALALGIILAVGVVAVFAHVPSAVELAGNKEAPLVTNTTQASPSAGTEPSTTYAATVTAPENYTIYFGGAVSNATNTMPVGALQAAIGSLYSSPSSQSTANNKSFGSAETSLLSYGYQRSQVIAISWRDFVLFSAATVIALTSFVVARRFAS